MPKKRKVMRKKGQRRNKVIVISVMCLFLCLCVGYAAFQTNISITAKGNVIDNFVDITDNIVTTGDGLYEDETEAGTGRYIYKGENPDNYIWFNDEMWRIIAKEVDGTYKIIKDESVTYQEYENPNWEESSLNNYLTNTYYTSLSDEVKANIISHDFANGGISDESADLNTIISEENASTWNSYVGLISISDYLKANSNTDSCNTIQSNRNNLSICIETNWLYNEEDYWVINYNGGTTSIHYYITNTGDIDSISRGGLYNGKYVRPVVILTSDITLTGKGTEENPYKIN